jgi:hypothetical protein
LDKLKAIPRFVWEIILTAILYMALWVLWDIILKEYIVLSDQGLSTIGLALSTSVGVLTAIVVSFVLITWQSSRQERSTSFWRWRNTLLQLSDSFDADLEVLSEIVEDVINLTWASAEVSLISPMPRGKFKELSSKVWNKATEVMEKLQGIKEPSKEEVAKGRAYSGITNHLVHLTTANFEHIVSHNLYRRVLSLRRLLYRLLAVLIVSILVVAIGVTSTSIGISDIFNAPLAAILIAWVIYVLINLGREIKRVSMLEDEFRRQEEEQSTRVV